MALILSDASKLKLNRLCQAQGMSQNEIVNILIEAVDAIELKEMTTERVRTGDKSPRSVLIQPRARWEIRP